MVFPLRPVQSRTGLAAPAPPLLPHLRLHLPGISRPAPSPRASAATCPGFPAHPLALPGSAFARPPFLHSSRPFHFHPVRPGLLAMFARPPHSAFRPASRIPAAIHCTPSPPDTRAATPASPGGYKDSIFLPAKGYAGLKSRQTIRKIWFLRTSVLSLRSRAGISYENTGVRNIPHVND